MIESAIKSSGRPLPSKFIPPPWRLDNYYGTDVEPIEGPVYFLNYGNDTIGKKVFDSVIKKHFKNNIKEKDWHYDMCLSKGMRTSRQFKHGMYLDDAGAINFRFFTIVSKDGWTLECNGVDPKSDVVEVNKLTAPDGSVFITDIVFKEYHIFDTVPRWIRKQYRELVNEGLHPKKYKRNSKYNSKNDEPTEFIEAANKLNELNNMSEEEMVKQAVVKDDPKPDEKLKKPLEKLIEKEAADKENGN